MADNFDKNWLQKTSNKQAITRATQAIQNTGRALPCRVEAVNGAIVTVSFEVLSNYTLPHITIPKAESPWIRMPTQVGDFGITMPADAYLGGISGLGGGVASLTKQGNLSALVFVPVSNKSSGPINPNQAQISGPQGAIIQTEDGTSKLEVTNSGIILTYGGKVVSLTSAGFTIDGILFENHLHSLVETGTSDSGPPVP